MQVALTPKAGRCGFDHWTCVGLTAEDVPPSGEDWYCSQYCEETNRSLNCVCRRRRPNTRQILCSSGVDNCAEGYRFHVDCITATQPFNRKPRHNPKTIVNCSNIEPIMS